LLGVDYLQWQAVTRTLLRTDFRLPLAHQASRIGRWGTLLGMAVMLALFGVGAAVVVVVNDDVLLTGTIALTYLSVMLATTLLTQHGSTMLSTADYVILGSRPVSSRTFLAIRITNVLFHTLLLTSLMAFPVVIAYAVARGPNPELAAAAVLAIYGWAVTIALTLVVSYTALLNFAGAARFQRTVGYMQLMAGFLSYGGIFLSGRILAGSELTSATMPDRWWVLLIPPAWFASYLELAGGPLNSTTALRAVISLVALGGLGYALRSRLGVDYARQLAELPVTAGEDAADSVRTPLFERGEARAAAILVVAHFRHDLRVRLGILAIVPLVFLYLFIGRNEAPFDLVALAVLLFPALLSQHFAATESYQGSWIYRATPADPARLVIALKNIAVVYFLLPFLLFVAAVFAWRFGDVTRAVAHTAMLGVISHIVMLGSVIISPRLPFALPPDKMRGNATLMGWMLVVIIGGQLALATLDRWVYVTAVRTLAAFAVLIALTLALNRALAWRARRLVR
jgi:hypothetical protein